LKLFFKNDKILSNGGSKNE
jgi:hypothetical protein